MNHEWKKNPVFLLLLTSFEVCVVVNGLKKLFA